MIETTYSVVKQKGLDGGTIPMHGHPAGRCQRKPQSNYSCWKLFQHRMVQAKFAVDVTTACFDMTMIVWGKKDLLLPVHGVKHDMTALPRRHMQRNQEAQHTGTCDQCLLDGGEMGVSNAVAICSGWRGVPSKS
jgi:hypothetical protein